MKELGLSSIEMSAKRPQKNNTNIGWKMLVSLCVLLPLLAIHSYIHNCVNTCSLLITYSPAVTLRANRFSIHTSYVLPTQ